jgi:hypothetical protein
MKAGVDDFLVAHGPEALADLLTSAWTFNQAWSDPEAEVWWNFRTITKDTPRAEVLKVLSTLAQHLAKMSHLDAARMLEAVKEQYNLKGKDLTTLEKDIKAARKLREGRGKNQGKEQSVSDLQESHNLHPAIDFLEGAMTLGFRVTMPDGEQGLVMVLSDGRVVKDWVTPEEMEIDGHTYRINGHCEPPFINDTWGLDRLKAFLEHPTKPQGLFAELKRALRQYLDLPEPAYGLLAAWIIGTYFAHLFTAYPFIHLYGPKETGKSKTLEALRCVCFNAWKGRDISVAAMGDTVEGMRGTMLIDQAENLNPDLVGLLADSYKKAGGRRRIVEVS